MVYDTASLVMLVFSLCAMAACFGKRLPGAPIALLGAVMAGFLTDFIRISGSSLLLLAVLTALGPAGRYLLTARISGEIGSERALAASSVAGAIIALIAAPWPFGYAAGGVVGAFIGLAIFGGRSKAFAAETSFGRSLPIIGAHFFELMVVCFMAAVAAFRLGA